MNKLIDITTKFKNNIPNSTKFQTRLQHMCPDDSLVSISHECAWNLFKKLDILQNFNINVIEGYNKRGQISDLNRLEDLKLYLIAVFITL